MSIELTIFFTWYATFFLFGVIGLGITHRLFPKFPDFGYGFAKFLGLFLVSMVVWIFSILRIVPFTQVSAFVVVVILLGVSLFLLYKSKVRINKYILLQEGIFLVILAVWSYIRSSNPQAEGTEKFMNIAFMNSISRTEFFPPLDPWMSGQTINYYYLGHFFFTLAGKISGIPISYVYNLALVTIISQTFIGLNSIFFRLFEGKKKVLRVAVALATSFWITFGGNMHYVFKWLESFKDVLFQTSNLSLPGIIDLVANHKFTYWFPDATRIIPFAIDEFPAYSVVLGDVHGHYLGLPFLIICIGLVVSSFYIPINSKKKIFFNIQVSLLVMALYGINSWDMITTSFLFLLLHVYQSISLKGDMIDRFISFAKSEASLILPGLILMIPYFISFRPPVGGLGIVPLDAKRELLPWLLMWGAFIIISLNYFYSLLKKFIKRAPEDHLALLFFVGALCLILGVEVFFLKDIFYESNNTYFRTNTVFKFYYDAWIIWGVACGYFIYSTFRSFLAKKKLEGEPKLRLFLYTFLVVLVFWSTYSYIFEAVTDYYPLQTKKQEELTLDGNRFIQISYPEDYEALQWIKGNINGQPVILEAVGGAYTYYARISANSGLPTVMGWPTHEWQWRGSGTEAFKRQADVQKIYETENPKEFEDLVSKYKVEYIVVGGKEKESYPNLNMDMIKDHAIQIFQTDQTTIYKTDI